MKKALSVLLLLVMVGSLAACGGDGSSQLGSSQPGSSSAPVVSSSDPISSEPEPEPLSPEEQFWLEYEALVPNMAYLTGLPKDENYPEGKRITAVMVNNIAQSRPTRGLSEAKIVYEIKVEGGITRFMAYYEDYETMPTVGGIRSARDQFFQLLLPSWGFYIHDGPGDGNHPVNIMMKQNDYNEFDLQPNYGVGFRLTRPGMPTEYTEYTDAEHATKGVEKKGADNYRSYGSPIFNFTPYTMEARVPEGGTTDEIAIIHSSGYRTLFEYNTSTDKYMMSQFNSAKGGVKPAIDENNNEQLGFTNVVVLFAPMTLYSNSPLVKVDYNQGGGGFFFGRGGWEPLIWRKGAPNQPLRLYSIDGNEDPIFLNPGTTYIAVVDDDEGDKFYDNLRAGAGSDVVAGGEVNSNEVDIED